MYHPMKRLEAKWNSHTPVWLHNRTKENLIFQVIATVIVLLVFYVKDLREENQDLRGRLYAVNTDDPQD